MAHPPRALIIEARFYEDIADHLLAGAERRLASVQASYERLTVPGVLEIPSALAMALRASQRRDRGFDIYVVLGCVIRGETGHYDIVAGQSNRAIMDICVAHRLALGNGILTCDNGAQAFERAKVDGRDKGGVAVGAALALLDLRRKLAR